MARAPPATANRRCSKSYLSELFLVLSPYSSSRNEVETFGSQAHVRSGCRAYDSLWYKVYVLFEELFSETVNHPQQLNVSNAAIMGVAKKTRKFGQVRRLPSKRTNCIHRRITDFSTPGQTSHRAQRHSTQGKPTKGRAQAEGEGSQEDSRRRARQRSCPTAQQHVLPPQRGPGSAV